MRVLTKNRTIGCGFLCLWMVILTCHAELSVIDFENSLCSSKIIGGYVQIENSRGTICATSGTGTNSVSSGSRYSNDVENLTVRHVDGQIFTPLSMKVGEYSLSVAPPSPLIVSGNKADGSQVVMEVFLDGVRDGPNGEDDFELIVFPSSFSDLSSLQFGAGKWSLDDFVAEAPVTPPVVAGPMPRGSFASAVKLLELPSTLLGASDEPLVFLDHYTYRDNDPWVDSVVDARGQGSDIVFPVVRSAVVDPVTFDSYQGDNSIRLYPKNGPMRIVADLATVQGLGYDVTSIRATAAYGGTLLFAGYNHGGSDSYYLFTYQAGKIAPLVTPTTALPVPGGGVGTPYRWPDYETIGEGGIAFDTSTSLSTQTEVVFEQAEGTTGFRRIVAEGEDSGFGTISRIVRIDYQGPDLVVDVQASQGIVRLVYQDGLRVSAALVTKNKSVAAEAVWFSGSAEAGDQGARIINWNSAVYQTDDALMYRVIGPDDVISGSRVVSARYVATSSADSGKILVEIIFSDLALNGLYEIGIGVPKPPDIKLGEVFLWPEPRLIYMPVDYATQGRVYTLLKSTDLSEWVPIQTITEFEIRPRFSYPVSTAERGVFFKVSESEGP